MLTNQSKQQMQKEFCFVVDEELYNATKQGDIEKVKIALESGGFSPDARYYGWPLLSIAAQVYIY